MSNAVLILAAIAHGREGLELAEQYLADLSPPVVKDVAPLWAAFRAAGEQPGEITFAAVVAQDPELSTDRWVALLEEARELNLRRLEDGLNRYRRWHFRRLNTARMEKLWSEYRKGHVELETLESATSQLGDGASQPQRPTLASSWIGYA